MVRILIGFALLSTHVFGQAAIGNEKFDQKQYADAAAAYQNIPPGQRDAGILNRLGISYHILNRIRDAENAYKAALRLDSQDSDANNNLGALYYAQRKFSDAERQVRKALEHSPDNTIMRLNLRASRYARENAKNARVVADTLSKDNAVLVEKREGDLLQVLVLMPAKDLETATLHERRGDSFFARKMYEDAIIEYRKSIALDRYNASTLNRLGLVYHQSQRLNEAEQSYREALKQNPFYLEALNNIGTVAYVRKDYDHAMEHYNKALKIRPESPTILLNIGACLFAMERYDEGYKAYQRALEIDPKAFDHSSGFGTLIQTSQRNESTLNFYLAKVFAGNGDKDRAISYLYKAVEEGFKDAEKIKAEPAFALLTEDERFVKLMEALSANTPATAPR